MIDVRNPGDGFRALRARVNTLGPPAASDRGRDGAPLTVGEWALLCRGKARVVLRPPVT